MTIDDALRIIDPATTREALAPYAYDPERRVKVVEDACRLLVDELRKRIADERNDPLTMEELKNMVGKPVYLKQEECWVLVGKIWDEEIFRYKNGDFRFVEDWYKRNGTAYRRPPKEGAEK